ncbi:MAG: hypothetical protein ACON33_01065 [Candidatus Micropelagos thuwalensis]
MLINKKISARSIIISIFCKCIYLVFPLNRSGPIKKNNGRTYQYTSLSRPDEEGQVLIDKITNEAISSKLTARGYNRIKRVARTIADLDGCEHLAARHIA